MPVQLLPPVLYHVDLETLAHLPDDAEFYASFGPVSPAHLYVMVPELRDYVIHRSYSLHGSWQGTLGCDKHQAEPLEFRRVDQDAICPGCHHRNGNHPTCERYRWLTVQCGGEHVKL